ncbi:MAG: hypothetical protein LBP31_02025 [Holosporales bacterium]|jgi:hypothetical protein|nr:hypothetical protein [Holosporales bacterium]
MYANCFTASKFITNIDSSNLLRITDVIKLVPNSPGIVVFQEHFFQGALSDGQGNTNVMIEDNRNQIGKWISSISPHMLWLCNCTTIKDITSSDDDVEEDDISKSGWIQKKTKKFNINKVQSKNDYEITKVLQNRTDFWHDGKVLAIYRKSTYCDEAPQLIVDKNVLYIYGDCKIHKPKGIEDKDRELSQCIIDNFYLEICKDYSASRDKINNNFINLALKDQLYFVKLANQLQAVNFHIIQSDSILPRQVDESIEIDDMSWINRLYKPSQKYWTLQEFPKYFIVADSCKQLIKQLSKLKKPKQISQGPTPEFSEQLFLQPPYFAPDDWHNQPKNVRFVCSKSRTLFARVCAPLSTSLISSILSSINSNDEQISASDIIQYKFTMIEPQNFISVSYNNVTYRISIHKIG